MSHFLIFAIPFITLLPFVGENDPYLKTIFLSELDYSKVKTEIWPVQKDKSIAGGPLLMAGKRFKRGIGVHANSTIEIDLGGDATRFRAHIGVDAIKRKKSEKQLSIKVLENGENLYFLPGEPPQFVSIGEEPNKIERGSVIFSVWADGRKIFESDIKKGGEPSEMIDLNIRGFRTLILEVFDAGDGLSGDHADWAEARILYRGLKPTVLVKE